MPTASRDPASEIPPEDALTHLAARLRDDETVASAEVIDPATKPHLGMLVAAGPRAAKAPGDYSFVIESVREGYLLHYGTSRLLSGVDPDLALLAGDYLYALGIEHLSRLGDEAAVVELSDLISLCAHVHANASNADAEPWSTTAALWSLAALAIADGGWPEQSEAKRRARELYADVATRASTVAAERAQSLGVTRLLERALIAFEVAVSRTSATT